MQLYTNQMRIRGEIQTLSRTLSVGVVSMLKQNLEKVDNRIHTAFDCYDEVDKVRI